MFALINYGLNRIFGKAWTSAGSMVLLLFVYLPFSLWFCLYFRSPSIVPLGSNQFLVISM
ncbi:hypothetical protein BDV24DRAFT_124490, partial [Aspergillus arachidicola]